MSETRSRVITSPGINAGQTAVTRDGHDVTDYVTGGVT